MTTCIRHLTPIPPPWTLIFDLLSKWQAVTAILKLQCLPLTEPLRIWGGFPAGKDQGHAGAEDHRRRMCKMAHDPAGWAQPPQACRPAVTSAGPLASVSVLPRQTARQLHLHVGAAGYLVDDGHREDLNVGRHRLKLGAAGGCGPIEVSARY
jgi:hypothetical protein